MESFLGGRTRLSLSSLTTHPGTSRRKKTARHIMRYDRFASKKEKNPRKTQGGGGWLGGGGKKKSTQFKKWHPVEDIDVKRVNGVKLWMIVTR